MPKHVAPLILALAMLAAGNPWQSGNWGGGLAASGLVWLLATGIQCGVALIKRGRAGRAAKDAPAEGSRQTAYDRDREHAEALAELRERLERG
ncbi:hypothetical protein [Kitasatospora sp. McL0602]|uniref:hypothetical protein n=1 Tax=Kitasatospora sp. McL0602 TaxID=3439530 RepID=UPI003F89E35F